MKQKISTTIVLACFFLLPLSGSNDIFFHKISVEQGLSQFSVMAIYQDEFGDLWFGTREGVNRYNGNSMEVILPAFNDKNVLPESLTLNVCGDKNGHVYIHSQNGVTEYDLVTSSVSTVTQSRVDVIAYGINNLWLSEKKSLYAFRAGQKTLFTELSAADSPISCIYQATDARIYVGTISSGVFVIDPNKRIKKLISGCSQVSCIYEDDKKNLWVATWENGVYKMNRNGDIINYNTNTNLRGSNICSNYARALCQDNNGDIWIGTYKGLSKLNPEKEIFTHYNSGKNSPLYLSNESVWSLLKDEQGTIWAGTYFGGVNYFNPDVSFYTFHDLQNGVFQNKPFPVISEIIECDNQSLFLCSEGNGLIYYHLKDRTYQIFLVDEKNPNSISANNIKAAYYDSEQKKLWVGTHLGGIYVLDARDWKFTKYPAISEWRMANNVHAILPYKGKLLIATQNGLFLLDTEKRIFSLFSEKLHKVVSFIQDVKIDGRGNMWIASINGVYKYNPANETIESYFYNAADSTSLSNNNATKLLIDSKDRIWIATSGGGVNRYCSETNDFIRYTKKNGGLINDYVSNLRESFFGRIIISTTEGLAMLDVEENWLHNFGMKNGFPLNSLYNGGINVSGNGELYIAGMDGLVSFYEEDLIVPHKKFKLNMVNLWVNNNIVLPGDNTGILQKSMRYTDEIRLSSDQRMISIEFASDNYIQDNRAVYRYKLSGSSEKWIELQQGVNRLNFMNLSPGDYHLAIEGLLSEDRSIVDAVSLRISISPPVYNTWYAYLLYLLLVGVVILWYVRFSRSKLLLKHSLDNEKREKEHLEKANQSKLRFF
ncbi:MAG: hypothetical protein LBR34_12240, partial [Prevotella sp.]|nr:hypothetical protein [Prevotella sp.]